MGTGTRTPGLRRTHLHELVEMTTHRCRSELETIGELGGGGRAVDEQGPSHALTRGLVTLVPGKGTLGLLVEFHNASVPLFETVIQARLT